MINELKKYITGDLQNDCISMLKKYKKEIISNHTITVVQKAGEIGSQFNLDTDKLITAAYLHDISGVIPRSQYTQICRDYGIKIIDLEEKLPILLHQKVSKIIAEKIFNINNIEILSAISCHTTLKVNPSKYDMALFIADKLMWDQGGVPSYFDVVNAALNHSLEMACLAYIDFVIDNNLILIPHPDLLSAKKYLEDLVSSKQILLH